MRLSLLIALPLMLVAGSATSQTPTMRLNRIPPPMIETTPNSESTVAQDPQEQIARLVREKKALRDEIARNQADLQAMQARLDEMTHPGGSLVRAYCDGTVSRNTAGASEDCTRSGYACQPVNGLCHRECTGSDMCAPGFVCDTSVNRCVNP